MSSILVLDDRASDRELLVTLLGADGHSVRESSTGQEALRLARAETPDLVITDIPMQAMDGYEFVRLLHSDPDAAAVPVVFCTAIFDEADVKQLAAACGVSHFIAKPPDPAEITATVTEVLGTPRARPQPLIDDDVDREHLRLLNEKLVQKVDELESANAERRKLVGHLISAHEEERKRICEDIHDDSIQAVVALRMRLEILVELAGRETELGHELDRLREDTVGATGRLRRLLVGIQPVELDKKGLAVALEIPLAQAHSETGLTYKLDDRTTRRLTPRNRTLLYRVGREALANVLTHSHATHVDVSLDEDSEGFSLSVRDDGTGFDTEQALRVRPGHLGLPAMREQVESSGGRMELNSRPDAGTSLRVWLPEAESV
jgi:signal transduction histidine kinase